MPRESREEFFSYRQHRQILFHRILTSKMKYKKFIKFLASLGSTPFENLQFGEYITYTFSLSRKPIFFYREYHQLLLK